MVRETGSSFSLIHAVHLPVPVLQTSYLCNTHTCTCTHTHAHIHTKALTHAHTQSQIHTFTCTHTHTHTHTQTHTHTHKHTCTYTYIHTQTHAHLFYLFSFSVFYSPNPSKVTLKHPDGSPLSANMIFQVSSDPFYRPPEWRWIERVSGTKRLRFSLLGAEDKLRIEVSIPARSP